MTKAKLLSTTAETEPPDVLVPDKQVCAELAISDMTLKRWREDPKMDFPVQVKPSGKPNGRGFCFRRPLEMFKAKILRDAIAKRSKKVAT
jgi:hypothetical protein